MPGWQGKRGDCVYGSFISGCFNGGMRWAWLILLAGLCGCADAFPPLLGADVASVVVFGRSLGDVGASAATGRDCSIVRLDQGKSYCAEREVAAREVFCTRTLATVDCWAAPVPGRSGVADAPVPSRAQENHRQARWPKVLTANP